MTKIIEDNINVPHPNAKMTLQQLNDMGIEVRLRHPGPEEARWPTASTLTEFTGMRQITSKKDDFPPTVRNSAATLNQLVQRGYNIKLKKGAPKKKVDAFIFALWDEHLADVEAKSRNKGVESRLEALEKALLRATVRQMP